MFWYDHIPPTENDKNFFNGAADAIEALHANNTELETVAKKKGIEIYDNNDAIGILDVIIEKNEISEDFFYELEKAQLILLTKMFLNNCKVNNECTEETAKKYSERFVQFANKQASKNRDTSQFEAVNRRNDLILRMMVHTFSRQIIKGMFDR